MKTSSLAFIIALLTGLSASPNARAQSGWVSGLYQIVSGQYTECCGFAGNDSGYLLPHEAQTYVNFKLDEAGVTARLTFLAQDAKSVFSVVPCPPPDLIEFNFGFGNVFPDRVEFHVDPGPPPHPRYWDYIVTNETDRLYINGSLRLLQPGCSDTPNQFGHTNVVAVRVAPPRISLTEFSKEGALLMVQGLAGWTDVLEGSSDLVAWTPISTNVMPATLCPVCPYILVRDPESTNLVHRFYRSLETP
jgi:hypothetical protein